MQNENGLTGWRHPRVPWSATDALIAYALVLFVTLASIVSVTWLADTDGQDTIAPSLTIAVDLLQGLSVLAAWYFGMDAYELLVQLAIQLAHPEMMARLAPLIPGLQACLDSAELCDDIIVAAVPIN